jgi:pyruvate dehydrogenase E2 component (dihydrolipoamide acetyltransferase)
VAVCDGRNNILSIDVIMPVLGMAQDTGKILRWLKSPGEQVKKGEPLIEVETDKAIAEIEAPGDGVLEYITANEGDEVPVAAVIARILAPEETRQSNPNKLAGGVVQVIADQFIERGDSALSTTGTLDAEKIRASPVARRLAEEQGIDLRQIQSEGGRIEKTDVLTYLDKIKQTKAETPLRRVLASPKARRILMERGINPNIVSGSGPEGAILTTDVVATLRAAEKYMAEEPFQPDQAMCESSVGAIWRVMAERTTQSWQSAPHFYLMREVNASQLIVWRESLQSEKLGQVTYTDLLVMVVTEGLRRHPRINASWKDGQIALFQNINIGVAVATENGLVVPVIHNADHMGLREITVERERLVQQARSGRLHLDEIGQGTFTLSNLGMLGVDVFNAVINPPQAAILAIGRIAERVVPLNGQPAIQPMMTLSLSCDHRVVDGSLGAMFLKSVAEMIEQPLKLLSGLRTSFSQKTQAKFPT